MKKNIFKILMLLLTLIISAGGFSVKATNDYEDLKDQNGQVVRYRNTTKAIQIPTFYEEKDTEFRGAWVSFYAADVSGYNNKTQMMNQLLDVLETFEYYNLNTILFHVRTHNNAYYPTELAPLSSDVDKCDFDEWDYLEWFIEECHSRGIEFHAWLNPYRISSTSTTAEAIKAKYADCPKNPANNLENVLISKTGDGAILNPAIPSVRDYIVDVCLELMENYDIDAIHFDDYFYINGIDDTKQRNQYNTQKLSIGDFRRQQIDLFIKQLSDEMYDFNVKNNKAVQLGISPTGIYRNGSYVEESKYKYDDKGNLTYPTSSNSAGYSHYDGPLYCDTKNWVDNEWIDYIIPQNYQSLDNSAASHAAAADWWNAVVKNKDCKLYMGLGTYKMDGGSDEGGWHYNDDEMLMQLRYNANLEHVDGVCVYQYKTLARNISDPYLKKIPTEYWTKPALNPVVTKYENNFSSTASVSNLKIYESEKAYALSWDKNEEVRRYAVYKTVSGKKSLVGFVGNGANDFVAFTDNEKQSGATYSVVPLTRANSFGKETSINTSAATELTLTIGKLEVNVGQPERLGSSYNVIFDDPIIYFGDKGTYQIFTKEGDDGEWEEVVKSKEFIGTNQNRFTFNKYGKKVYLKVVCTNSMGVFESEVYVIAYYDTPETILDYIYSKNEDFLEGLFRE